MQSFSDVRKSFCLLAVLLLLNAVAANMIHEDNWQQAPVYVDGPSSYRTNNGRMAEIFKVGAKREKIMGYGWEQCEFSPMSCLLRRRRRSTVDLSADSSSRL
uniref:Secreted protein n=1 Tax=Steinernema glaseri TaxID=37863 RepID=A0A1I8ADA8_9BILA